jgi:hypothetical protein
MRWLLPVALLVTLVGGGCESPKSTKYTQTWAKAYTETPCSDWANVMDNHQRFVAAGDMLVTLRTKDGNAGLPADEMIGAFALDISDMCAAKVGQIATIAQVAPLVYLAFPEEFKP